MNDTKMHDVLMAMGHISGCHQMAERSFFFRGYQFPICARCTGVFLGYLIGITLLCVKIALPIWLYCSFCGLMYVDWKIQDLGILESNNWRRLITGTICGVGYMYALDLIVRLIQQGIKNVG